MSTPGSKLAAQREQQSFKCPVCGTVDKGLKTKVYCSESCKQKAKRHRPLVTPCTVEMFKDAAADEMIVDGATQVKFDRTNHQLWHRWYDVCCTQQFGTIEQARERLGELIG